jgi:O-antigen ligase
VAKVNDLELVKFRVSQILLLIGPLITLAVNPWTNYDPISLPKVFVLATSAFAIISLALANFGDFKTALPRLIQFLALGFLCLMTLTLLFSGSPLSQQIWGSFGRNNGYLTYTSLLSILLVIIWVRSFQFYLRLSWIFVLTSIPMTVYCLIQIVGRDPIPWSEFNTFGTLGNINFLSAFLGMTSIGAVIFALDKDLAVMKRLSLSALAVLDLWIILSTGSIQGPIIFAVGVGVYLLIFILDLKRARNYVLIAFWAIALVIGYFLAIALKNLGPLASFVYQPSVVFRGDYVHAGWEMTLHKPIFGVGMDSYGDWYREARGEISTLRTGPDRVANTAHNIFLDISSNGGVLLGATYVALISFALYCGIKVLRSNLRSNSYFKVTFAVWVAYQIQALVSINQIGVGIWGWMFSGVLIGFSLLAKEIDSKSTEKKYAVIRRDSRSQSISAKQLLIGVFGLGIGMTLSAIPLNADMRYRGASNMGNLGEMRAATSLLGSTQFHRELVLDFAMRNNLAPEIKELAEQLVRDYPRSFYGWRVLSVATLSTDEQRFQALERARALDPFNPDLR